MTESTRPQGAPENGDGGIDGDRGPMPPPSGDGGRRAQAALFGALLHDRRDADIARMALRRRVDLRPSHGLLLVCAGSDPLAAARAIAGRLPRAVAVPGEGGSPAHAAVVLPVPAPPIWVDALAAASREAGARSALVLPRAPVAGLRALRAAYFSALADAALAVALDLRGPLVAEPELVVPRMLAALPEADQAILLAPLRPILDLPAHNRDAYVRTVEALHRHGGTCTAAAAHLHIHANTVRYRTARIEELTGLRLDDPGDRLRLDLAAILVRLRGLTGPPPFDFTARRLLLSWDGPYVARPAA